jgi:hypothetical protein
MRVKLLVFAVFVLTVSPSITAAADTDRCAELLKQAASELSREQYPSMLTAAQERRQLCGGGDSEFLVGLAQANLLDKLLVGAGEEPLVREQAMTALHAALDGDMQPQWRQTAGIWLKYLESLPTSGAVPTPPSGSTEAEAAATAAVHHRAAAPFVPTVFPWGPVIVGSVGVLTLTAALVTGVMGNARDEELHQVAKTCPAGNCGSLPADQQRAIAHTQSSMETLYAATNVLLIVGAASVTTAVVWYLALPSPDDHQAVMVAPYVVPGSAGGTLRLSF